MATNDRSVGLSDLAARTQAGPRVGRQRSACRNPECRDGLTPGVVAAGGGTKGQPLFGAGGVGAKRLMRWAWIPCLACNAPDDARKAGAVYRNLNLSEGDIARRAQMANTKAAHNPQEPRPTLSRHTQSLSPGSATHATADSGKLAELAEQNKQLNARLDELLKQNAGMTETLSRMTVQIAALLEDNAKLRAGQTVMIRENPAPTPPRNDMGT
jgi:hypothetical protein